MAFGLMSQYQTKSFYTDKQLKRRYIISALESFARICCTTSLYPIIPVIVVQIFFPHLHTRKTPFELFFDSCVNIKFNFSIIVSPIAGGHPFLSLLNSHSRPDENCRICHMLLEPEELFLSYRSSPELKTVSHYNILQDRT